MERMTLEDIEKITGNPTKLTLQDIEKITGNPTVVPKITSEKTQKIPSLSSNVGDPGYKKKRGSNIYIGETVGGDDVARMAKKNKVGSYSSIRPENSVRLRESEPEEKEEIYSGQNSFRDKGIQTQDNSSDLRKSSIQTQQLPDNKQQPQSFDESRLDQYTDPSYKLNAQERKEAKKFIEDYYKNTPGLSGGILKAAENAKQRANWSEEEQEKYEKVVALENKLSSGSAIMAGIAGAFDTFTAPLEKMAQNVTKSFTGEDTDVEGELEEQMEGTKRQHPIASTAGNIGGQMAKYAMGSTLAGQIPALGKAANTAGRAVGGATEKALSGVGSKLAGSGRRAAANVGEKLLSGGAKRIGEQVARSVSNIAGDMTLDLALDTIPRISENAREGMSAGEIAADAGRNIAQNLGWNVLGEAGGVALERIPEISQYFRRRNSSGTRTADIPKDVDAPKTFSAVDEANVKSSSAQINSNAENAAQETAKNAAPVDGGKTVSEKEILNIINDENLRRAFTDQTGVRLSGSRDDMANTIRETLSDSFGVKEISAMDQANAADITAKNAAQRLEEIERGKKTSIEALESNLSEYNLSEEDRKRVSTLLEEMSEIQNHISVGKDSTPIYEQLFGKINELDKIFRGRATKTTPDDFSRKAYDEVVNYLRSTGKSIYVSPSAAAEFPDGVRSLNQQFSSYGRGITFTTDKSKGIPLDTIMGDMEQLTDFKGTGNDIEDLANLTEYLSKNKAGRMAQTPYTGEEIAEFVENTTKTFDSAMDMSGFTSSGRPLKISKTRTNTLPNSEILTETEMARYMPENDYRYIPVSEKESMSEAAFRLSIDAEGWKQRIMAQDELSGKDVDTLMMLYKDTVDRARQTNDENLWQNAAEIFKKIQNNSTKAGQEIQALSKWKNNTPEGILLRSQRSISDSVTNKYGEKYAEALDETIEKVSQIVSSNKTIPEKMTEIDAAFKSSRSGGNLKRVSGAEQMKELLRTGRPITSVEVADVIKGASGVPNISSESQKQILDIAYGIQGMDFNSPEAQRGIAEINAILSQEMPMTKMQKVVEASHIAMLLNPRTQIRNVLANVAMLPQQKMSNKLSALGQHAYALVDKDYKPTQAFKVGKDSKNMANAVWDDLKDSIERGVSGKYNSAVTDAIGPNQAFGTKMKSDQNLLSRIPVLRGAFSAGKRGLDNFANKVGAEGAFAALSKTKSSSENIRQLTYGFLALGDTPFVKSNFVDRLSSYIEARGIKSIDDIPEEAINIARDEALKATFKDDNALTKVFQSIKRLPVVGETVFPFTKTPANLIVRSMEYSPAGIAKTLYNIVRKKGDINNVFDDLAKGTTGTLMTMLGIYLAGEGVITGNLSDDADEAAFQKQQGVLPYSVSTAGLADFINRKLGTDIDLGDDYYTFDWSQPAATSLVTGSTINNVMESGDSMDPNNIADTIKNAVVTWADTLLENSTLQNLSDLFSTQYGGSVANNVLETLAETPQRLIPSVVGATARAADPVMREAYSSNSFLETQINNAISKIPVLSKTLPVSYDTWGNPRMRSDAGAEAAFAQFISPGQLGKSAKTEIDPEIQRLYETTGEVGVFPTKAKRSVGDQKLSNEEYSEYQKEMGQLNYELASSLIKSSGYEKLSDSQKADLLSDLYSAGKKVVENKLFGKDISGNKLAEVYLESGTDGVMDYIALDNAASQFKSKDGSKKSFAKATQAEKMQILDQQDMTPEEKGAYMYSGTDSQAVKSTFEEYGNEGVWNYYKVKQAADPDGSGSFSADAAMSYLDRQDYSDEEKGFYMYQLGSEGKTRDRFYSGKGYEGVYDYYKIKSEADYNGNGNLAQNEVIPYISSADFPREVKRLYLSWLFPNAKENPF